MKSLWLSFLPGTEKKLAQGLVGNAVSSVFYYNSLNAYVAFIFDEFQVLKHDLVKSLSGPDSVPVNGRMQVIHKREKGNFTKILSRW